MAFELSFSRTYLISAQKSQAKLVKKLGKLLSFKVLVKSYNLFTASLKSVQPTPLS